MEVDGPPPPPLELLFTNMVAIFTAILGFTKN